MLKTQNVFTYCSNSAAFVDPTYLINTEKRGKVGWFVLCCKKCSVMWHRPTSTARSCVINCKPKDDWTAFIQADIKKSCREMHWSLFESPRPCMKTSMTILMTNIYLLCRACCVLQVNNYNGTKIRMKSNFSPYALFFNFSFIPVSC